MINFMFDLMNFYLMDNKYFSYIDLMKCFKILPSLQQKLTKKGGYVAKRLSFFSELFVMMKTLKKRFQKNIKAIFSVAKNQQNFGTYYIFLKYLETIAIAYYLTITFLRKIKFSNFHTYSFSIHSIASKVGISKIKQYFRIS